jgi:PhnB protein
MAAKKNMAGRAATAVRKVATKAKAKVKAKKAAPKKVQAVPPGYGTITPSLVIAGAAEAIEFYKRAFGAKEMNRMPTPDGKIMHAELKIGDSVLMMSDDMAPGPSKSPSALGGTSAVIGVYTKDADGMWAKATQAGAKVLMPLSEQFWGDKYGQIQDPFGHVWSIMQHVRDVSPKEMAAAAAKFASGPPPDMGGNGGASGGPESTPAM